MNGSPRTFVVLCPHFAPDIAPTGRVMTQIVDGWIALGHEIHVVTSLPWYRDHRVEPAWQGRFIRREHTVWGSITRIHPFPAKSKTNLVARAFGFVAFSAVAGVAAVLARRSGGRTGRVAAVVAMSPPLTLGLVGWLVAVIRRSKLVFNVQDVFPDAAIKTGVVRNPVVISVASWLERFTYRRSSAVVVLSRDLQQNVRDKLPTRLAGRVHVIENFVDVRGITPANRMTDYRRQLGIGDELVVMYAGNVGFSQSLDVVIEAARHLPQIVFVVNGSGSALGEIKALAGGLGNVRFGDYQPEERLPEVLATADIHLVPLRRGLSSASVPSKTYSILAAGRSVVAAVDPGTEIERLITRAGAGICIAPDDPQALTDAIALLAGDAARRDTCGRQGRAFVEGLASARDVAESYDRLVSDSLNDS